MQRPAFKPVALVLALLTIFSALHLPPSLIAQPPTFDPTLSSCVNGRPQGARFRAASGGGTWYRIPSMREDRARTIPIALGRILHASLWEAFRKEYTFPSSRSGRGMLKSSDGGDNWTKGTSNPNPWSFPLSPTGAR